LEKIFNYFNGMQKTLKSFLFFESAK